MRVVTVEEHFTVPSLVQRVSAAAVEERGYFSASHPYGAADPGQKFADLGTDRIEAMEKADITVQVLSYEGPGADLMPAAESPAFAREANDVLAQATAKHPDRFAGFAHLPWTAPDAVPDELERAVKELGFVGALVNGSTGGKFLDDPSYEPFLARAEALDVPVYIHPGIPPMSVRQGYYESLPKDFSYLFGIAGWGWHVDTAVHILRLVLSGALDRHPRLQLITGHMGEGLPAMLVRFDQLMGKVAAKHLQRPISQTIVEQVYVSTSGFVTVPPLLLLLETFGADRVLFSADYPFLPMQTSRDFLDQMPVSAADRAKIAHSNADRLLKLKQ